MQWDVLWSLAVEEQFYLLFPVVVLATGSRDRLIRVLAAVIATGVVVRTGGVLLGWTWLQSETNSFSCFDAIAFGVLCAVLGRSRLLPPRRAAAWVLSGTAVILGAYLAAVAGVRNGLVALPVSIGACLFLHGALTAGIFTHWVWRIPARIGQLSYGLYLLHSMVLYLGSPLFGRFQLLPGLALFLPLCFAAAQAVYSFYENPLNRSLRSLLLGGSRARAATAGASTS
jgi:peptidoglycan/LPS O-acetylase OafA/YrhL